MLKRTERAGNSMAKISALLFFFLLGDYTSSMSTVSSVVLPLMDLFLFVFLVVWLVLGVGDPKLDFLMRFMWNWLNCWCNLLTLMCF